MKQIYIVFILILGYQFGFASENLLVASGTISGNSTVCQNSTSPIVTFTGSGGTAPYTFTYTVTGTPGNQTIQTTGINTSITLPASTGTAGTFIYNLVSVHDSTVPITEIPVTGQIVTLTIRPQANADLNSSASSVMFNGFLTFRECANQTTQLDFFNASSTTASNTSYTIDWGDGSPVFSGTTWNTLSHNYQVGLWTLTYSISAQNGCNIVKIYKVFVGNNPAVGLGNPGNTDICISSSLTFPITGTANNPPGTTYVVTFNDGSPPISYNHPPPASVTHSFLISSCNTTSTSGTTTYQNSFFASIAAINPCDQSSASVVPIRISTPPIANFNLPQTVKCVNNQICLTNTSTGGDAASSTSCSTPKIIWTISPNTGFTLVSGSLGDDFGSTNTNSWTSGSASICPTFSIPGNYSITMKIGNRCGIDQMTKIICIESPLIPLFTLNTTTGCTPLAVTATNNTNVTNSCTPPTYLWQVTHTPAFCSTTTVSIPTQSIPNASYNFTEPGTYSIRLTTTNSCGAVASSIQTITVKKPPTVSLNTVVGLCQNISFTPSAAINGCPTSDISGYLWTFTGGTPASATSPTAPSVSYVTGGNYTITLAVTNSCGTTTAPSNTFAVQPAPTVQNETTSVCSGVPFSVTPSAGTAGNIIPVGTTYSWSNPSVTGGITGGASGANQTSIIGTLINPTNLVQTATYTVTPKFGSCTGAPFTVTVTINPSPVVTFSPAPQTLCSGDTSAIVNLSSVAGATLNWTVIPPAGISGVTPTNGTNTIPAQTLTNSTNAPITITYNASATTSGSSTCAGALYPYTIIVKPSPRVTENFTPTVCSASAFSVMPANSALNTIPTGTTYTWSIPTVSGGMTGGAAGNAQTVISGTLINPTDTAQTATYSVTPTTNGCTGTPFTITVTVNPKPFIANVTPAPICSGNAFAVTPTNGAGNIVPAGTTFTWTVSPNANLTGQSASSAAGITTISQTLTNISNSNQLITYTVTPSSAGCPGNTFTITISVNPKPIIANSTPPAICSGNSFTVNPSTIGGNIVPAGTSYTWSTPISSPVGAITGGSDEASGQTAISQTLSNITTTTATLTYTVTPLSGGCAGNPFTIAVTVNPTPVALSLTNQIYCNGAITTPIVFSNMVIGTTYSWLNSNTAIGLAATGSGDIPAFTPTNTTNSPIGAIISVVPTANGCAGASQTFTITVNPAPTVLFSPAPQSVCSGDTSLSVTLSSTITGATFNWSVTPPAGINGITTTSGTNTIPAETLINTTNAPITITYNATATTASGSTCPGSAYSYTIVVNPIPTVVESFNPSVCSNSAFTIIPDGTINSLPTGTTYSWNAPVVTGGLTGGATGSGQSTIAGTLNNPSNTDQTATYIVTPNSNGCPGSPFTFTVIVNPKPVIANVIIANICSDDTFTVTPANGGVDIVPIGTTYTWTVASNTNITGQSASNAAGVTTISQTLTNTSSINQTLIYTVTPASGSCTGNVFTITVAVDPKPMISNLTPAAICSGNAFSVAPVDGSGNIVPAGTTYTWGNPISNPVGAVTGGNAQGTGVTSISQVLTNTTNDIATLTYTVTPVSGSCSGTPFTITMTLSPIPAINTQSTTICSNNAFLISPVAGGANIVPLGTTYTWTAPVINPPGAVTGAIAQNIPQSTISQNLINTTTSPATVTYTVIPTSGVCIGSSFTVTVTVNPSINPNVVATNNACFGVNIASITTNITGGIPPYSISWTGPVGYTSAAGSISNLVPGVYNLLINDLGNCPYTNNYTITEPTDIVITVDSDNDISCYTANNGSISITVTGGTGSYGYTWTNGGNAYATTEDISNLGPGNYVVSVTDANNCGPKTMSFTITEPPLLVVTLVSQTNVLCYGAATGAITTSVSGGTPGSGYAFLWTGPGGFTSASQNLVGIAAGTYYLTVTDANGCVKSLSVVITQSTDIVIAYTTTPITCYGANNASLAVTLSGGNPPYQFQWSNLSTSLMQTNLSAGNYTITVTDNVGCIQTATIVIPQAPIFTVNPIVTNVTCHGLNNGSINLNLTGGIAPVALSWSDGSTAGLIRNNLVPGTYTATISDGTPCYIVRTFTIVQPSALVLSANLTNAINCTNASSGAIDLVVAGGTVPYTFSWSNGALTEDLTGLTSGNYAVIVTDANGCTANVQFPITRPAPILIAVATQTDFDCAAHTVDQSFVAQVSGGIPPIQLQWSSGTVSGANSEIMQTSTNGTVLLTATDSNNCIGTYSLTVATPTLGYASFDTTSYGFTTYGLYAIGDPIQFQNTITGDYVSVSWDFGDGTFSTELNPVHTYLIPKDYIVTQTVTYPFGCVYVQTISLLVEKGYVLVVPTAFTPNNDTVNDTYRPVTKGLRNVVLDIYDTWGSLIYSEKGDVLVGWDAKIKGLNAENGNYYSKVRAETFYGTIVNSDQTFVLIK